MKKRYRIVKDWECTIGEDDTDFMTPIYVVQKRVLFRYKTLKKYYSEYFARKYISEMVADFIIKFKI